ncbi:sulfotransferase [Myxococcota bacterium]|nr:sulfotransferase [Myxococcota bacterium]
MQDHVIIALRRIPYRELFPHFSIIGAQKSGTTSLHYYLDQHPDVFMAPQKETNLLLPDTHDPVPYSSVEPLFYGTSNHEKRRMMSDDEILRRMLVKYKDERLIGEASPYYTFAPIAGGEVPERTARIRPGMKFVYSLRNPLERIISNHEHDRGNHERAGAPIRESIDSRVFTHSHLLDASLYWFQLSRYLLHFPSEQIHVVILEELSSHPDRELADLCRFLQLDSGFDFDTSMLYRASPIAESLDSAATSRAPVRFSQSTYEYLMGSIRDDVRQLESYLGRKLDMWDLSKETWCR